MTPQLYDACRSAVHVITADGQVLKAGQASLFVLENTAYPKWLVRPLSWPPIIWFVELGYWLVARNRTFFGRFLFTRE